MIKITDLIFSYEGHTERVLKNINININDGEFVAILGHNGSGKSTLAKHLNGIFIPDNGKVYIDNLDTSNPKNLIDIRKKIGMVFQNPDNQIVATIVEDDVAFGLENLGIAPTEIRIRVDEALKTVNMFEHKNKPPHSLSGGQKQRVAIAGVLAMEPKTIVLDEPTAMLDPIGRKEVMETLLKLNKEKKITIILVTHNMDEAVLADRILVMNDGNIVLDNVPSEVFKNVELIKKLGLDVPQSTYLIHELSKKYSSLNTNVLNVKDAICELNKLTKNKTCLYKKMISSQKTMQIPIIECKNISYVYSQGTPYEKKAISNVNLTINKGEIIGLIGHTGSGKSTLIQHLNCLLTPSSGAIYINNVDMCSKTVNKKDIRKKIGLVFQYPEYQLFEETVALDVGFGPKNLGLSQEKINERVKKAIKFVGLNENILKKSPFELSGGQKRRVAIAGVLAIEPEVLILDEPTAGLDPKSRDELLSQLKTLQNNLGIAMVIVSHSMEEIAKMADRLIVVNDGSIILEGNPNTVFEQRKLLEDVGLSTPQVTKIIQKLTGITVSTVNEAIDVIDSFV